ncbi:MAG: hypothetical protein ABR555_19595, partial [Pyrinomonadaceae bacterium]
LVNGSEWAFTDVDAIESVLKILEAHAKVAGEIPCAKSQLALLSFPQSVAPNKWSAQTRGCTVTLLMGRVPSKVGALSQLGLALTHELFHLWIPNGLALKGDYDWFYEGKAFRCSKHQSADGRLVRTRFIRKRWSSPFFMI